MKSGIDLEKRTTLFGIAIIEFCKSIPETTVLRVIIVQLVKSGTSMGANYMEANNASSRKDFQNKIFICKKEAQETKYWLDMLLVALPSKKDEILKLSQEAQELLMIFQKIITTLRKNGN